MAEWSKALVLGTSHYGGAGSNPARVNIVTVAIHFLLEAEISKECGLKIKRI